MDEKDFMEVLDDEDFTVKIKMDRNTVTVSPDPLHHGFWQLSLDRGALPDRFRGKYTKKILAVKAAESYVASRAKE